MALMIACMLDQCPLLSSRSYSRSSAESEGCFRSKHPICDIDLAASTECWPWISKLYVRCQQLSYSL